MSTGQSQTDAPIRSLRGVKILGSGRYVPERVVTNHDLCEMLGFDPEWIVNRTGIHERRFAPPHQATSDLGTAAAERCLADAGCDPGEVDLLVVGTMTPDMAFPSTGCLIQDRMKLRCPAFDLQAACAGFMYAMLTAAQFVAAGTSKRALAIGADCNSRVINPGDQKSYPLFGDGAGAVLLGPGEPEQGFLAYQLGSDGSGGDLLNRPACGSRLPPSSEALTQGLHYLTMDGRAVFKWAVRMLADSSSAVLEHAGQTIDDVRWFIPHQANIRIIHAASDVLGFRREKVFKNLEKYGNTSGGSIPIAFDELRRDDQIQSGDLLLLSGFGAGLAWGTALLRY
ncbi:beta-ketoacyl-ACP synthase III [Tautonia marina]|uniref:beta-ketoacyl-ACP synthase III n=1 Tax=Tautonia marina TaxID=2653855 RepID=UPI001260A413|nr:beta-ketoacyl-ACP synthase III [Tautonia marina]